MRIVSGMSHAPGPDLLGSLSYEVIGFRFGKCSGDVDSYPVDQPRRSGYGFSFT